MKRKALFIGVNNYTNGLPALSCAVNDAGALQEFFEQCGYETSIIRNADTNNILSGGYGKSRNSATQYRPASTF